VYLFPSNLPGLSAVFLSASRRSVLALGIFVSAFAAVSEGTEGAIDFNRDIRPILSENCFYCHGQDGNKREAGLRLDVREEAVQAGAFHLERPSESSILHRIFESDPELQMPPPKSNRKLTAQQRDLLQRWILEGAPYAPHWSFTKPVRSKVPSVRRSSWVRNPIDQFVLAKLEKEGMSPSPEADRPTVIKRLYADLIGLPPSPTEVDAFVSDADPRAYENLVEKLLKSEHYGERMALPWLDAARYADSNGFQQDGDTWQWMWRDWVVKAINENLPFDDFVTWQLAGDLLPDATTEQKIASGFNRNHLLNGEGGAIAEEQRFVILFDRMDTTATTFLGLTMSCAQCHDHKYDPITQKDYYSLMDAFNRVPESGTPQYFSSKVRVANPVLEVPTEEVKRKQEELDQEIASLEKEANPQIDAAYQGWRIGLFADNHPTDASGLPAPLVKLLQSEEKDRSEEDKKKIEAELRKHFDQKVRDTLASKIAALEQLVKAKKVRSDYLADHLPRPMVMSDAQPRQSHILLRGEYLNPGEKVSFATPKFLPPMSDSMPKNRLGFARWLTSEEQPLMARVHVNRVWQSFFGVGIVKTAEDFGIQSEYPIHMELLDWLAVEFRESGWDMKQLHRTIVTSATYRQSSKVSPEGRTKDPENRWLARGARMRMPAMVLRDWALASSNLLDRSLGGKPVYPYQPDGIWESLAITKERDFTYPVSSGKDLYRRSLYTFWRRTVGPANMFDASNRQTCRVRVSTTSTPLHALTTLNDPTWVEAARSLAGYAIKHSDDLLEQIRFAFRQVLGRHPKDDEIERLRKAWDKQSSIFGADEKAAEQFLSTGATSKNSSLNVTHYASLAAVCLAIYNLDEALTRE
jgi:hypothetical protein